MSATGWKLAKITVIAGACIGVVGYFGGAANTATIVQTSAAGTGWGIGVGLSSLPAAATGLQAGFSAKGAVPLPSMNSPLLPAAAAPKPKKVPNCTPKQKKAAPASCA